MLAPLIVAIPALLVFAVLPWGPGLIGQDLNVGILFIVAIGTIHVLAIIIAGWGANNKFALLSTFRVVNQLLAYEIPMVLCILAVVLFAKTMSTQGIVEAQTIPYFVVMPVAGLDLSDLRPGRGEPLAGRPHWRPTRRWWLATWSSTAA